MKSEKLLDNLAMALSYADVKDQANPILSYKEELQYNTTAKAALNYNYGRKCFNSFVKLGFTVEDMSDLLFDR